MSGDDWHASDCEAVAERLATSAAGLSGAEARARLERHGPNSLEAARPTSAWAILLHQLANPLIYVLLSALVVTVAIGDLVDAAVIAVVLALDASIGFVQEKRAEASVRALLSSARLRARVLRDGRLQELDAAELVPGDLVALESGARVPADLRLAQVQALRVDESLLTGESTPVDKRVAPVPASSVVADRASMAYCASLVTSGRARGYVVATGARTQLGAIARSVSEAGEVRTPLQARMARFARTVAAAVLAAAAGAFLAGLLRGEAAGEMFLVAVTLAVSGIPEGLPVVQTITLAIGVRRMAARKAVIRRLPAVETLGSTSVIASDKTGTLTENRMSVVELVTPAGALRLEPGGGVPATRIETATSDLLEAAVLANEAQLGAGAGERAAAVGDPTELALLVVAQRLGLDVERVRSERPSLHERPFEPSEQHSASVRSRGTDRLLYVKGAPERVLEMCSRAEGGGESEWKLERERALAAAAEMASRGLRVLAYAQRVLDPAEEAGQAARSALAYLGLSGMIDPPRPGVREAIASCGRAGIRVLMITGDHARTAQAIARQLGLGAAGDTRVALGSELALLDEARLEQLVGVVDVFARIAPEQKLAIVRALRRRGEVVAVTGDGVNDAPALEAADVGIAMGRSGTDVAREAADVVLTDDDFVSIVAAVEEGRTTFGSLRKVTFFLVSTGAAEMASVLAALAIGLPLPYLPAQILWLNLVTNGLQDVALAFEPGEPDVLRQPPRRRSEGILSACLWERAALAGLVMAAGTLAIFAWELAEGRSLPQARSAALTTMVLFQTFHLGNARSEQRSAFSKPPWSNPFLVLSAAAALGLHVLALYLPLTRYVLRVEPLLEGSTWLRMGAVAASILVAMELHKRLRAPRPARRAGRVRAQVT